MKHVYRRGLGLRYGRKMQAIAGVHYNYSYPDSFWQLLADVDGQSANQDFISSQYFALARNVLRFGWLIPYLFGASPAVCGTFFGSTPPPEVMKKHAKKTYYEPFATSLRMGDIGYQNNRDESTTTNASYNNVDEYVAFLQKAITEPSERYEKMGLYDADGEYQQLNTNLLQIENEHYSSIRPKQITEPMEMPSLAMQRRGVRYVELRSLDVNAYEPLGINDEQLRFLESFMLFCMLCESPPMDAAEQLQNKNNLIAVAHRGRDPDLTQQLHKIHDPSVTPSGQMLQELFDNEEDFFNFGLRQSVAHKEQRVSLSAEKQKELERFVAESIAKQKQIESSDESSFEEFLKNYHAQLQQV